VPADEISRLAVNIQALEVSLAGTAAIEVKSDWLRIPKERLEVPSSHRRTVTLAV